MVTAGAPYDVADVAEHPAAAWWLLQDLVLGKDKTWRSIRRSRATAVTRHRAAAPARSPGSTPSSSSRGGWTASRRGHGARRWSVAATRSSPDCPTCAASGMGCRGDRPAAADPDPRPVAGHLRGQVRAPPRGREAAPRLADRAAARLRPLPAVLHARADQLAAVLLGRLRGDRPLHLPHRGPRRPRPRPHRLPGPRAARNPQGPEHRRGRRRLPARAAAAARRADLRPPGPAPARTPGAVVRRLDAACAARGARRILGASTPAGEPTRRSTSSGTSGRCTRSSTRATRSSRPLAPTRCSTGRRSASPRRSRASSTSRAR